MPLNISTKPFSFSISPSNVARLLISLRCFELMWKCESILYDIKISTYVWTAAETTLIEHAKYLRSLFRELISTGLKLSTKHSFNLKSSMALRKHYKILERRLRGSKKKLRSAVKKPQLRLVPIKNSTLPLPYKALQLGRLMQ